VSKQCVELRRIRRSMRMARLLPGLTAMGGLFGVTMPLPVARDYVDQTWIDYLTSINPAT
jgi:hypothetical protein